jgi:FG-GAP-like repeat
VGPPPNEPAGAGTAVTPGGVPAGPQYSRPVQVTNQDGREEAFTRGTDGHVYHAAQLCPGCDDWTDWTSLGGLIADRPAAVLGKDGRIAVAVLGNDSHAYYATQTSPGSSTWTGWTQLGSVFLSNHPTIAVNADGRLQVFGQSFGNPASALLTIWQTSPGSNNWSQWTQLGDGLILQDVSPTVVANADGRLEVVVAGGSFTRGPFAQALMSIRQTCPGCGFGQVAIGGGAPGALRFLQETFLVKNRNGRLDVFTTGYDNPSETYSLYHAWQTSPGGGWTAPTKLPGADGFLGIQSVTTTGDGRVRVTALDSRLVSYSNLQRADLNGWDGWQPAILAEGIQGDPPEDVPVSGDYDGDGSTDAAIWRPSTGTFFVVDSSTGAGHNHRWGDLGDTPVAGDYDGDGRTDVTVYRGLTGEYVVLRSSTGTRLDHRWGDLGDFALTGDYDGDGQTDLTVWHPQTAEFYIRYSSTGVRHDFQWGEREDLPVVGDFDGDGKTDLAIWRPLTGAWWVIDSSTGTGGSRTWGLEGDVPVPADYDGDGRTDLAIWRPASATWWVVESSTGTGGQRQWGQYADQPAPGDYDGDGKADLAVWRPSTRTLWIRESSSGTTRTVVPDPQDRAGRPQATSALNPYPPPGQPYTTENIQPNTLVAVFGNGFRPREDRVIVTQGGNYFVVGPGSTAWYDSASQINLVLPGGLQPGPARVWVQHRTGSSDPVTIQVVDVAPRINPGGVLNPAAGYTPANIRVGTLVAIFGERFTPCCAPSGGGDTVLISQGGNQWTLRAGSPHWYDSSAQINVVIPVGVQPGPAQVRVTNVNGRVSEPQTINIVP